GMRQPLPRLRKPVLKAQPRNLTPGPCSSPLLMERTVPPWGARLMREAPTTRYGRRGRERHLCRPAFRSARSKTVEVPSVHATNIEGLETLCPLQMDSRWPGDRPDGTVAPI